MLDRRFEIKEGSKDVCHLACLHDEIIQLLLLHLNQIKEKRWF